MDDKPRCALCGEPMQEGETMFKYHGSLGPCPKPPLPKPRMLSAIRYFSREDGGKFWLDIEVDGNAHNSISFDTDHERSIAYGDLLLMMRSVGAVDAKMQ